MRTVLGWAAWESDVNKALELKATAASGSQAHDPGDGVDRRHHSETDYALQVDAKHTIKGSYAVNRKFMRESWERAMGAGQHFALPIRFADAETGTGVTEDYVVVPFDDYVALVREYRTKAEEIREAWIEGSDSGFNAGVESGIRGNA